MKSSFTLALILSLLTTVAAATSTVRIGVSPGPEAEILAHVQQLANQHAQINIELISYSDPTHIHSALSSGKLDAASFEDGVALAENIEKRGYALASAAQTVTLPLGLYSQRFHQLGKLHDGATIIVPRDAHNQARALLLLHNYGLIVLRDKAGTRASLADISRNPRKFHIEAAGQESVKKQLARADLVALDFETAARSKLAPARDGLGMEDGRSPYAKVLTVRRQDKEAPWLAELIRIYRSDTIKQFILTQYQDSVRRPW